MACFLQFYEFLLRSSFPFDKRTLTTLAKYLRSSEKLYVLSSLWVNAFPRGTRKFCKRIYIFPPYYFSTMSLSCFIFSWDLLLLSISSHSCLETIEMFKMWWVFSRLLHSVSFFTITSQRQRGLEIEADSVPLWIYLMASSNSQSAFSCSLSLSTSPRCWAQLQWLDT